MLIADIPPGHSRVGGPGHTPKQPSQLTWIEKAGLRLDGSLNRCHDPAASSIASLERNEWSRFRMTSQTNLYRLWFVITALFDWPKERFSNRFDEKYGESNHVSSLLVLTCLYPTLSNWVKVITFRMLPDAIFSSKIHE